MKNIIVVAMLSLAACGQMHTADANDPRTVEGVHPELRPYLDMYIKAKGRPLYYSIPMDFAPLSGNTIGLCTSWTNGYRQIEIDPDYWEDADEDDRIALVFHELGHCDLNRGHVTTFLSNGWPTSFMYPYDWGFPSYMQDYYFDELFNYAMTLLPEPTHKDESCYKTVEIP